MVSSCPVCLGSHLYCHYNVLHVGHDLNAMLCIPSIYLCEPNKVNVCLCFCFTGSVHCTSSPKHPPDALLKATAQHRRARSAAWSYRFPVNEEWCELVVSLPTAILLQEVHIQPHSTGLSSKCLYPLSVLFTHILKNGPVMTRASARNSWTFFTYW